MSVAWAAEAEVASMASRQQSVASFQERTMAFTPAQPSADKQAGRPSASHNRGFASMDPERQRQIASEGGRAAHERGTAHEFSSEEARQAGSKGGQAAHERGTAHE